MSAHPPPVPPANRSQKGTGKSAASSAEADQKLHPGKAPDNLAEQGQQGNTKQNTTNQGYQQDR